MCRLELDIFHQIPSFKLFLVLVLRQQSSLTFQERLSLSDLFLFGVQLSDALNKRSQPGQFGPLGPQFVLTALLLRHIAVDCSQTFTVLALNFLQVLL